MTGLLIKMEQRYLSRYNDLLRACLSRDGIPVNARFSVPVQTVTEALPASYTMCTVSFPGVNRPGLGVDKHLLI